MGFFRINSLRVWDNTVSRVTYGADPVAQEKNTECEEYG